MLKNLLPTKKVFSKLRQKIWKLTRNTKKWSIKAEYSSKYATILITYIGKYQTSLYDLLMFILLNRILDWTVTKGLAN